MGTKTDSSLKGRGSRLNPANQLPRGNYRNWKDTVLDAELVYAVDDTILAYPFTPGQLINVLVFCQDVPVYGSVLYQYNGVTVPSAIPVLQWRARLYVDQGLNGALPALFTPDPSIVLPLQDQEQVYGETTTNGVPVAGYFMQAFTVDWGLEDGEGAINPLARATIMSKGSVLEGDVDAAQSVDFSEGFQPVFFCGSRITRKLSPTMTTDTSQATDLAVR